MTNYEIYEVTATLFNKVTFQHEEAIRFVVAPPLPRGATSYEVDAIMLHSVKDLFGPAYSVSSVKALVLCEPHQTVIFLSREDKHNVAQQLKDQQVPFVANPEPTQKRSGQQPDNIHEETL